jgi:hypothetical protein
MDLTMNATKDTFLSILSVTFQLLNQRKGIQMKICQTFMLLIFSTISALAPLFAESENSEPCEADLVTFGTQTFAITQDGERLSWLKKATDIAKNIPGVSVATIELKGSETTYVGWQCCLGAKDPTKYIETNGTFGGMLKIGGGYHIRPPFFSGFNFDIPSVLGGGHAIGIINAELSLGIAFTGEVTGSFGGRIGDCNCFVVTGIAAAKFGIDGNLEGKFGFSYDGWFGTYDVGPYGVKINVNVGPKLTVVGSKTFGNNNCVDKPLKVCVAAAILDFTINMELPVVGNVDVLTLKEFNLSELLFHSKLEKCWPEEH